MKYSLQEKIGDPELLVGRENEFGKMEKWIANIPKGLPSALHISEEKQKVRSSAFRRIL